MDYESTHKVLAALDQEDVRYVVFGGVALNLHGLARATEDLDLFVEPSMDNVERLRRALHSVFEDPSIEEIRGEDLLGDYPAVQYVPPDSSFYIDIVTRLGCAFTDADLVPEWIEFEGFRVPIVSARTLYDMKKATVRPKDWGDAERLRLRFGLED